MNEKAVPLIHPFKDALPDVDELFLTDNEAGITNTVNAFCYKVKKLAAKYANQIDPNDFKGLALELFAEYLCKTNASDNRIGIYDYRPITAMGEEDVGADGVGIGDNQHPATVQVKFRSGDYILTANEDHLSNFLTASIFNFNVRIEDDKNMLIITTGLKVDEQSREKMLKGKVRVLNRYALQEMLDNRPQWWINFYESVKGSRVKISPVVPPIPLRPHQTECVVAVTSDPNGKGKIVLPTGTGKTKIEASIAIQEILDIQKKGITPIIKINSPRILLCFQLFEEFFKEFTSHGISASYINYNSGKSDDKFYTENIRKSGGIYQQIVSTTSTDEVKEAYNKAVQNGLPLVIFSTYNSAVKFARSGIIPHLTIHDEAHNLVSNEFSKAAGLPSVKNFYFTATEKITESALDIGMNNVEIFDNMIYAKSPKQMIDAGEMVPPHIHVVKARDGGLVDLNKLDRDYEALLKSISQAFFAHQRKIREDSFDASQLGAKILVVCRGQEDLKEMFNTELFDEFREQYPDIHIFALSSDFGIYNDDEGRIKPPVNNTKKFHLLNKIKALSPSDKAIIFHVDMVGEGIDVPGITGVMPFRNCELAKFVQNVGRASRLHPVDRKRIYANEINVDDRSKWIKPCSWVIVPNFLLNAEGFLDRFQEIVKKLRTDYGFIPQQETLIDNVRGMDDDEEIDKDNEKVKNPLHSDSGLEEFDHEFEKVSLIEQILLDDKFQQDRESARKEIDELLK